MLCRNFITCVTLIKQGRVLLVILVIVAADVCIFHFHDNYYLIL